MKAVWLIMNFWSSLVKFGKKFTCFGTSDTGKGWIAGTQELNGFKDWNEWLEKFRKMNNISFTPLFFITLSENGHLRIADKISVTEIVCYSEVSWYIRNINNITIYIYLAHFNRRKCHFLYMLLLLKLTLFLNPFTITV